MFGRKLLPLSLLAILVYCAVPAAEQKVLYEKDSSFSTIVVTEDEQGLRTLSFEKSGARQSVVKVGDPDHLVLPYVRTVPVGLAFVQKPRRVLIVGLGGGSIPNFLHKHYPKTIIDAVDIDPVVVDVAKRFFGFREDATLRAHVADGRQFIEKCTNCYDIILLDAFSSKEIPYSLATREFLKAVRRVLTPNGIVVGNIWSRHSNPLHDSMVRTYQDVFRELYIFDVRGAGNEILVARPRKGRIAQDELARRAKRISQEKHFRFDLGELVEYGYRYAEEIDPRVPVLLDGKRPDPVEP